MLFAFVSFCGIISSPNERERTMTHFNVAVLQRPDSPTVDELLYPYDENLSVEPYVYKTRDEALVEAREDIAKAKEQIVAGNGDKYASELASHDGDNDEDLLDWYADEWCERDRDADGNLLSRYNPESRYDYYTEMESLSFTEWLATGQREDEDKLRETWKKISVEGDGFWKPEYYTENYGDEDTFVAMCQMPAGWAVITPDGVWHEPGKVGWFATDDATVESRRAWVRDFHEKIVAPYDDGKTTVVMLDCHI